MACKDCKCKKIKESYSIIDRVPGMAYIQKSDNIREFSINVDPLDLQWHFDEEDRTIRVLSESTDWQLQYDNELPIDIIYDNDYYIPRGVYHRIIKNDPSKKSNNKK